LKIDQVEIEILLHVNDKNIIFSHLILKINKEKIKAIIYYIYSFNVFKLLHKMKNKYFVK